VAPRKGREDDLRDAVAVEVDHQGRHHDLFRIRQDGAAAPLPLDGRRELTDRRLEGTAGTRLVEVVLLVELGDHPLAVGEGPDQVVAEAEGAGDGGRQGIALPGRERRGVRGASQESVDARGVAAVAVDVLEHRDRERRSYRGIALVEDRYGKGPGEGQGL